MQRRVGGSICGLHKPSRSPWPRPYLEHRLLYFLYISTADESRDHVTPVCNPCTVEISSRNHLVRWLPGVGLSVQIISSTNATASSDVTVVVTYLPLLRKHFEETQKRKTPSKLRLKQEHLLNFSFHASTKHMWWHLSHETIMIVVLQLWLRYSVRTGSMSTSVKFSFTCDFNNAGSVLRSLTNGRDFVRVIMKWIAWQLWRVLAVPEISWKSRRAVALPPGNWDFVAQLARSVKESSKFQSHVVRQLHVDVKVVHYKCNCNYT